MYSAYTLIPYRRAYISFAGRGTHDRDGAPHHRVFVCFENRTMRTPCVKAWGKLTKSGSTTGFG
jgi:hypothetical protein